MRSLGRQRCQGASPNELAHLRFFQRKVIRKNRIVISEMRTWGGNGVCSSDLMLPHANVVNSLELDRIPWQTQRPLQDESTLSVSETSLFHLGTRAHLVLFHRASSLLVSMEMKLKASNQSPMYHIPLKVLD